jgi:glutamyl-tRNA synthetase
MNVTRTRFAPSPTGALHAGTVRTALFAWLVAKHNNGQFILRIEDTDQARAMEGAVKNIEDSLHYIGIDWDEGPGKEGQTGPYLQSERLDIYKEWAKRLIDSGRAYADPYSKEELDDLRDEAKAKSIAFLYRNHRPENPRAWDGTQPLRFKSDPSAYRWDDAVLGELSAPDSSVDDFILMKSDGFPTYNFAHIVDDHLMEITHVIRSSEFLSSIPRYLNLYDALNIPVPIMATVPNVLNETGNKKLSKREGAKQILEYRDIGILPAAMVNFLVMLGWNDGTTQEIFSLAELIKKFDLSRVQKSGAKFDENRLFWLNGHYIRGTNLDELFKITKKYWPKESENYPDDYKKKVLGLIQERLKYFTEIPDLSTFFFKDLPINKELIKTNPKLSSLSNEEVVSLLKTSRESLEQSSFELEDLNNRLNGLLETTSQKPAVLFSLIRIATTNAPASPGLAETLAVLGKEVSIRRIDETLKSMS